MDLITFAGGILAALVGQFLKSKKSIPNEAVQLVLATIGFGLYVLRVGPPFSWWPLTEAWSVNAVAWICALPGLASMMGNHPALKTDSRA